MKIKCLLLALASVLCAQTAGAATRTVTSLNDDGGAGTLRSLIAASAANDTINFTNGLAGTITLTTGELVIGRNLTIIGPDAASLTLSGNSASRVLNVTNATVKISNLTISNGRAAGNNGANGMVGHNDGFPGSDGLGGGILNNGNLMLTRCTLSGNSAIGGNGGNICSGCSGSFSTGPAGAIGAGGGIYNNGTLTLTNCTFFANIARGGNGGNGNPGGAGGAGSGGVFHNQGNLIIVNCTLSSNTVTGGTGGNGYFSSGGNGGNARGGGVFNAGVVSILNTIIAKDTLTGGTGGRLGAGGNGNDGVNGSTTGPDVFGSINSQGHNLIRSADGSSGWVGSDLTGTIAAPLDLLLASLAFNGGPTKTMALQPTSAALDAGDDSVTNSLAIDQRGCPRKSGAHVDIGAVELRPPVIYEWTFDHHDLSAALGPGLLTYADAATPGLTSFGATDGATVPRISGQPAAYMHVPGFVGLTNGYLVEFPVNDPNGGGQFINQYTFIADVLLPGSLNNYLPFFNTNPLNQNDADFYIAPNGSLGIQIYSSPGLITSNTWYRIAFVADLASSRLTYFVNGVPVGTNNSAAVDGRWSLLSEDNPGADLLLFNEGDLSGVYTHEVYVAHVAMVARNLSASEIAILGGPVAEGIFARRLSVSRNGNSVVLNWRGASNVALQKATSQTTANWQTIGATLGASNYNETATSAAFYRLLGP